MNGWDSMAEKLGPDAEVLTRAGRAALKPREADRRRVFVALGARLGDFGRLVDSGLAERHAGAGAKPGPRAPGWPAISAVVAGLALGGGVLFQVGRAPASKASAPVAPSSAAPRAPEGRVTSAEPPPSGAATNAGTAESAAASTGAARAPRAAASVSARRPPRDASDSLAQEVALLSRAESALHVGRFAAALGVLAEHEQKFPRGKLAEERIAARVRALCGLGRSAAARAELSRLAPGSLLEARAKVACAVEP